jgi:hypothetical protein
MFKPGYKLMSEEHTPSALVRNAQRAEQAGEGFAAASKRVSPETVAEHISCGPSAERHLAAIDRFVQAGFDHIILTQVGPEQDAFIDFFERSCARRSPGGRRRKASEELGPSQRKPAL